jgi:hypothetical protein
MPIPLYSSDCYGIVDSLITIRAFIEFHCRSRITLPLASASHSLANLLQIPAAAARANT